MVLVGSSVGHGEILNTMLILVFSDVAVVGSSGYHGAIDPGLTPGCAIAHCCLIGGLDGGLLGEWVR